MQGAAKGTVVVGRKRINYAPSYRETRYRRPLISRLTPLSWFMVALAALSVTASAGALAIRAINAHDSTASFTDRLAAQPAAVATLAAPQDDGTQAGALAQGLPAQAVLVFQPTWTPVPTPTPAPEPTRDPNRAPWADQLTQQKDGTLMAPSAVISQALADLGAYYTMQRDLPLDTYLARHADILTTFFSSAALERMRKVEEEQGQYVINRSGRFSIEIQHFAADGLSARAGVITRDWVCDVYDVATKRLLPGGRVESDTLTIMTIQFDRASGRWKFASVDEVSEFKP